LTRRAAGSAILAATLFLAGCATAPPYRPTAPSFEGPPVFRVSANRIEVETASTVQSPDPAVGARLAAMPEDVARSWPARRLRADPGAGGSLVFTVEKAEATERYLQPKTGITALFTKNPEAEFAVAFAVSLRQFDASGAHRGSARAESLVKGTLPEGADEDDRRKVWERIFKDAAARLDQELIKQTPVGLPGSTKVR